MVTSGMKKNHHNLSSSKLIASGDYSVTSLDEKHTVNFTLASYWKVATEKRSSAN